MSTYSSLINFNEVLSEGDVSITDFSFVKRLDNIKIPQRQIIRVPGIEVIKYKSYGKLYCIKYYIINTATNIKKMIRLTSKMPSFNTLFSFDICDEKFNAYYGFELKDNLTKEDIISMVKDIVDNKKIKSLILAAKAEGYNLRKLAKQLITKDTEINLNEGDNVSIDQKIMKWYGLIATIIGLIGVLILLNSKYKKFKYWREEVNAETSIETDINNSLFKGQKEDENGFEIYANLVNFIKQVVDGPFPAVIICGPPGTSKTYIVRRTFYFMNLKPGKEYKIEKGATIGLIDIFALLYRMKNGILVLDDFDTPLQNVDTVNFLKSITDSYTRRVLSMPRVTKISKDERGPEELDIPQKFEYKGKLIIVTNMERNQLDKALLSRCPSVEVKFSTQQILISLEKMYKFVRPSVEMTIKKEVLDYMVKLYAKDKHIELNFRSYQNCVDARIVNPVDWKSLVKVILNYKG